MLKTPFVQLFLAAWAFGVCISADCARGAETDSGGANTAVTHGNGIDAEGRPLAALTFDDGPHPELTPKLLQILRDTSTTATFYVVGKAAKASPQLLAQMRRDGHEIGNHTWSHPDLRKLSGTAIREELSRTSKAVEEATGSATYGTRPPYGAFNRKVLGEIARGRGPAVLWTVDPEDWKRPGAGVVADRVLAQVEPGAIILLHDIHPGTIQAVPRIIEGLREKGYRLVSIPEILQKRESIDLDGGR